MARTGAKRRSEPGRARFLFGCVPIICGEWMGHDCCRPPQLRFVGLQYLFRLYPRLRCCRSSTLGYYTFAPRCGASNSARLRSQIIQQITPSTSDLSGCLKHREASGARNDFGTLEYTFPRSVHHNTPGSTPPVHRNERRRGQITRKTSSAEQKRGNLPRIRVKKAIRTHFFGEF